VFRRFAPLAVCVVLIGSGCHLFDESMGTYETIAVSQHHDTSTAIRKNERAIKRLEHGDLVKAEELLQEALVADVSYAPAHNNLGHVLFVQGKYYLAAWEFEYAVKLMPNSGEPLNNLGLIYETVGRYDEAVEMYESAIAIQPENQEYASNLTRLRVRRGEITPEAVQALQEVVYKDDRPEWKDWAGEHLHTKYLSMKDLAVPVDASEDTLSEQWIPDTSEPLLPKGSAPTTNPDSMPVPVSNEPFPILPSPTP